METSARDRANVRYRIPAPNVVLEQIEIDFRRMPDPSAPVTRHFK